MSSANLVRLNVRTADADPLFRHYGVPAVRWGPPGRPGVAPTGAMPG